MTRERAVVFMFGGQGSQYAGMGKDLYEHHPVFRSEMQRGDWVVTQVLRESVLDHLYGKGGSNALDRLVLSQATIVMVGYAMAQALLHEHVVPDYVWGSSLGEYTAAAVAGVWSLETALTVAIELGVQVERCCPPGGITAVLAPPETYVRWSAARRRCTALAGIHTPNHFTVAAETSHLDALERELRLEGIAHQRLPVHYAFHSPCLDQAKRAFLDTSSTWAPLHRPQTLFVSGVTGFPMDAVPPHHFWDAAREPILFRQGVQTFEARHPSLFVDCSASGTLANFVKHNLVAATPSCAAPILTPFNRGMRNVERLHRLMHGDGERLRVC